MNGPDDLAMSLVKGRRPWISAAACAPGAWHRLSGCVRRQESSSEPCGEKSHVMKVRLARRIAPCVVRHLRSGRQAGEAATSDGPGRCERAGWIFERSPVLFEVAVTSVVESNLVNID